ncbi:hypothetical protein PG997_013139 [Apiospora hydei]|uniref:Uncharacterized protein n=1 Tax=Apiospora hydei TaxID=1337664 RepID=A0ABR1V5B8_9PEZI
MRTDNAISNSPDAKNLMVECGRRRDPVAAHDALLSGFSHVVPLQALCSKSSSTLSVTSKPQTAKCANPLESTVTPPPAARRTDLRPVDSMHALEVSAAAAGLAQVSRYRPFLSDRRTRRFPEREAGGLVEKTLLQN